MQNLFLRNMKSKLIRKLEMDAKTYFEANRHMAGTCYKTPLVSADRVSKGEHIVVTIKGLGGIGVQQKAPEDGWVLKIEKQQRFFTNDELDSIFQALTPAEMNTGTEDLPEGTHIEPALKGDTVIVDIGFMIQTTAEDAGWVITFPGKNPIFMSDINFRAKYKTDHAQLDPDVKLFRKRLTGNDRPVSYIVLPEDHVFDFKAGPYAAKVGMVIFENAADEDGYTVAPMDYFRENFSVRALPDLRTPQALPSPQI